MGRGPREECQSVAEVTGEALRERISQGQTVILELTATRSRVYFGGWNTVKRRNDIKRKMDNEAAVKGVNVQASSR